MYKLKKLSGGLKILSVPMKNTGAFTLLVLVGTGSKYETKKINGISHFLEHMFFKGTADRPNPGQVNRELDSIGAQHNAFTSKEVTGYWIKAAKENFDVGLDIVSDILTKPLLSEVEIEREKGVVIQEIRMRNDDPMSRVGYIFEKLLWGDQPAGWEIAGDEATVMFLKRKDFLEYFSSQYVAKNSVVVIVGNYPAGAEKKIERAFASLKKGSPAGKMDVKETRSSIGIAAEKKKNEATNLILGFKGFDMYSPQRYALDMLGVILGGNSSSRLFFEVREKLGLAYYIGAGSMLYTDSGYFDISAGVPHDKVESVLGVVLAEIKKIKDDGVTKDELKKAGDFLRGTAKISLENSSTLASFFAEQIIFKKPILTPEENLKKLEKVTAGEIKKIANEIFTAGRANLALVGADHDKDRLTKLLNKV